MNNQRKHVLEFFKKDPWPVCSGRPGNVFDLFAGTGGITVVVFRQTSMAGIFAKSRPLTSSLPISLRTMLTDTSRAVAPTEAYLLAVVEVDKADRILCQAEGCGHSVYKRIHVVLAGLEFKVLGSQCYERLYGQALSARLPQYGSGTGRLLTGEERQVLVENTANFIERLETERVELERLAALQAARQHNMELEQAACRPATQNVQPARRFDPPRQIDLDERSPLYEGGEMLRWKWKSAEELAASVAKVQANPPQGPYLVGVLECFKAQQRPTPYSFALDVELKNCLPKPYIFRALHDLDLIERTHR